MNTRDKAFYFGFGVWLALALACLASAGCVTPGPLPTDNEMEYVQRTQEDATFARLSRSNSTDIAQSANALSRRPQ